MRLIFFVVKWVQYIQPLPGNPPTHSGRRVNVPCRARRRSLGLCRTNEGEGDEGRECLREVSYFRHGEVKLAVASNSVVLMELLDGWKGILKVIDSLVL